MRKDERTIKQIICKAFAQIPYPGDNYIVDNYPWDDSERNAVLEYFIGKSWGDINYKRLNHDYEMDPSACLSFMSDQAYRYYLPAFLLLCLESYDEADIIVNNVIYSLSPPEDSHSNAMKKFLSRMSEFTLEQKTSIRSFLEYIQELHGNDFPKNEPASALKKYWNDVTGGEKDS